MSIVAYKRPNFKFDKLAIWRRSIAVNDNEQKREQIDEQPFRCCQLEYPRREKEPLVKGALASADTSLLIQTDFDCSEMEQDDYIFYGGREWSIVEIQPLRTNWGKDTFEWVVLCH